MNIRFWENWLQNKIYSQQAYFSINDWFLYSAFLPKYSKRFIITPGTADLNNPETPSVQTAVKVAHYIREKFLKTARYDLIMKDTMIYNNYTWEKGGKYEIWVQKTWFSKISRIKYEPKVPGGFELGTCGLPNRCVTYWAMKLDNQTLSQAI